MPARLPEDQRSQADGLWAGTDHLHDGKLVALVQVWCPQPVLCTLQCTHTHMSPREKRWAYFNLSWDATWVSLSSISRVYQTLMILSTITVSIAFCLFLTVNGPTCGCHCSLHSIWTYMEYSIYGDIYGVQKILCKWVGCKYGQHIFSAVAFLFFISKSPCLLGNTILLDRCVNEAFNYLLHFYINFCLVYLRHFSSVICR